MMGGGGRWWEMMGDGGLGHGVAHEVHPALGVDLEVREACVALTCHVIRVGCHGE